MTIKETLQHAYEQLADAGIPSAHLDAEAMLSFVLKKPRTHLLVYGTNDLETMHRRTFERLLHKRTAHVPLAYLTGEKEFYGRSFAVDQRVLVPRPETELLVEETLGYLDCARQPITIVDVGTGSGCILITLAREAHYKVLTVPVRYIGVDNSKAALTVAKKNAGLHSVDHLVTFYHGDILSPLLAAKSPLPPSDFLIAANLPYVEAGMKKKLDSPLSAALRHEPDSALYSGRDGLAHYRRLAHDLRRLAKNHPASAITVLCEIGERQGTPMKKLFSFARNVRIKKDLAKRDRIAVVEI